MLTQRWPPTQEVLDLGSIHSAQSKQTYISIESARRFDLRFTREASIDLDRCNKVGSGTLKDTLKRARRRLPKKYNSFTMINYRGKASRRSWEESGQPEASVSQDARAQHPRSGPIAPAFFMGRALETHNRSVTQCCPPLHDGGRPCLCTSH